MQNISEILIATGNKGKFSEISSLLQELNIKAISPEPYNIAEPEENGSTFAQNSLIKAKYYAKKTNLIALADDSGLCIDLLDGQPGIHSARFAYDKNNKQKDFNIAFKKIEKALEEKGKNPKKDLIKAHFICNLTIFNPQNNQHFSFEGRIDGKLTFPPQGNKGFGYDPIFISEDFFESNLTFGQINPELKDKISHRAKAFAKLQNFLTKQDIKS